MSTKNDIGHAKAVLKLIEPSLAASEWDAVRSMLDEYIPEPSATQLAMLLGVPYSPLIIYVTFEYAHDMGWYYEEHS